MTKNIKALIILPGGWFLGTLLLFNVPKMMAPLIVIYGLFWLWSFNQYIKKDKPLPFFEKKTLLNKDKSENGSE